MEKIRQKEQHDELKNLLGGEVREKAVKVPIDNVKQHSLKASKSEKVFSSAVRPIDDSAR